MKNQQLKLYQTPKLEEQTAYLALTGVLLPIGTSISNSFEIVDVLGEEQ